MNITSKKDLSPEVITEVKQIWEHLLRTEDERKHISGVLCSNRGKCALGLLWVAMGGDFNKYGSPVGLQSLVDDIGDEDSPWNLEDSEGSHAYPVFNFVLGTHLAVVNVLRTNDKPVRGENRRRTFIEVADKLKELGIL